MNDPRYKKLNAQKHVLCRTDLYAGNKKTVTCTRQVVDLKTSKFISKEIKCNEILEKIINEIIDNAIDNSFEPVDPTKIIVVRYDVEEGWFEVSNDGRPISVKQNDGEWIPTMCFSETMCGTKLDDEIQRLGTGMYGMGCTVTNIFCKKFQIECNDYNVSKTLKQTWTDNMTKTTGPKITALRKSAAMSTTVRCWPDMDKFPEISSIEDTMEVIVARLFMLIAVYPKGDDRLKIYLNGKRTRIRVKSFAGLIKMYPNTSKGIAIFDEQEIEGEGGVTYKIEYAVGASQSSEFEQYSFANCLSTVDPTSTHVSAVVKEVIKVAKTALQAVCEKNGVRMISTATIKSKLRVWVKFSGPNLTYSDAKKTRLNTPVTIKVDHKAMLSVLKRSGVLGELEKGLQKTALVSMTKELSSTSRKRVVSVDNGVDARFAGSSSAKSAKCSLAIAEGVSAGSMAQLGFAVVDRNYWGSYCLKGKVLNARQASPSQLKENATVKGLMQLLGLSFKRKYETEEEFSTLRYGHLVILTDQDSDGSHITALVFNFIEFFWPALAQRKGYMRKLITPLLIVRHNKREDEYYFSENTSAAAESNHHGGKQAYIKGLATLRRTDVMRIWKNLPVFLKDIPTSTSAGKSRDLLNNCFGKDTAEWRKDWVGTYNEDDELDWTQPVITIDSFIDTELKTYSVNSIQRAIPSIVDGLKRTTRKVVWTSLSKLSQTTSVQVFVFGGKVVAEASYHHGDKSLNDSIIGLAQDFPGGPNNGIPLLEGDGFFGSRQHNGSDAGKPRYVKVASRALTKTLFHKDGESSWPVQLEDNVEVEPKWLMPCFPVILVRGAKGIGTAYSCFVPPHDLNDVITATKETLSHGQPTKALVPKVSGFHSQCCAAELQKAQYVFYGHVDVQQQSSTSVVVIIDELPFGVSIVGYKSKVLDKLVEKNVIKSYTEAHKSINEPRFEVVMDHLPSSSSSQDTDGLVKLFQLTKSFPASCMNLLDESGKLCNFENTTDIIKAWAKIKLASCAVSKQHCLDEMTSRHKKLTAKITWTQECISNRGLLQSINTEEDLKMLMQQTLRQCYGDDEQTLAVIVEEFLNMPMRNFTKSALENLLKKSKALEDSINTLHGKSVTQIALDQIAEFEECMVKTHNRQNKRDASHL